MSYKKSYKKEPWRLCAKAQVIYGFFLCGNRHNVQPFTELCKVNVEINVQLVVAESLYPLYQTAHHHFLCLYGGCVARLPVTVGLFAGFAAADTPPYQR